MSDNQSVNIAALPVSLVGLTQLEEVRVALERSLDGRQDDLEALDSRTQAWLRECLQSSNGEQLLVGLEEFAQKAPVIDLDLASMPTDDWRDTLVGWLRSQVSPIVLVRIHVRRNLLAGFRLRTGRHEYDMSLSARLSSSIAMTEVGHAN